MMFASNKTKMRNAGYTYIQIFLIVLLCCQGSRVHGQTSTGLEDKLILTEIRNFTLCNAEGKQFRTNVSNSSDNAVFRDGTYEIDLGDGTTIYKNLSKSDFPYTITYTSKGTFKLKFSALTPGGVKVTRVYDVSTVSRPEVNLQKLTTDVQCVGKDVTYIIDVYNKNTKGSVYTINYDDGTEPFVISNEDLKAVGGKVVHKYDHSYCNDDNWGTTQRTSFQVRLDVKNECGLSDYTTVGENVVTPIHAQFTFDKFDGANCTYEPIKLRNLTGGGIGINCEYEEIFWEWDFGNGKTSTQFEPTITYEEAKSYNIKLKATNNYTCAADSATVSSLIIQRVVANFSIPGDTICSGEVLHFTNRTQGQGLRPFVWSVVSLDGYETPEIINGDYTVANPQIRFNHYGRYRVTLKVQNGCTADQKDTIITVKQDPDIVKFDMPATLCPPGLDMSGHVSYAWNGNQVKPLWTVTREDGVDVSDIYAGGTTENSEYPKFNFTRPGIYHIKLTLKSVGCGGTILEKSARMDVYDPSIYGKVTSTPLTICEGGQVAFNSTFTAQNLVHEWNCVPSANVDFVSGTGRNDKEPILNFKKYGDYKVTLHLQAACNSKDSVFDIRVKKEPSIFHFEPAAAVCPNDVMDFKDCIIYQFYNNSEEAEWTITPATGYEFLEGTSVHSVYPKIRFTTPGNYQFTVKIKSAGCSGDDIKQEITKSVKVRNSAMTMKVAATDTIICEGEKVNFSNDAKSAEDDPLVYNWSVDPTGTHDFEVYGNQKSLAQIRFNHWGTYKVRGEASGYCGTLDSTITITVNRDPEVRIKDTTGICPGVIDMQECVSYNWFNNKKEVTWDISSADPANPAAGFEYLDGTDRNSLYPKLRFKDKGLYTLKAEVKSVGCKEEFLVSTRKYNVYDSAITVNISPDRSDVCENDKVYIRNLTQGIGLSYAWTVTGPEGGYEYADGTDAASAAPVFIFTKYGEYSLRVDIPGTCNHKETEFKIIVRGIPDISLAAKMNKVCAGALAVDMDTYLDYTDERNSTLTYEWQITPVAGFEYVPGFEADKAFPQIFFKDKGHYTVALKVTSQCVTTSQDFTTEIDVIQATLKADFSMPSEGCTEDLHIIPDNTSDGDSLTWKWEILPAGGWTLKEGTKLTDKAPEVIISEKGTYTFRLEATNICGTDNSEAEIRSYAVPEVSFGNIANVCETYQLNMADTVKLIENNDAIRRAKWTIEPQAIYGDGYNDESILPEVLFNAGKYRVKAQFWNGCITPATADFTVVVDTFVSIQPLVNDTLCLFEPSLLLAAEPSGGEWTLEDHTSMIEQRAGGWFFKPLLAGDYELLYTRFNGSCKATNTKKMRVHPLPVVEAGEALHMCLNEHPVRLGGNHGEAGIWSGNGVATPVFTPQQAGDSWLYYQFTDENKCTDKDSIVMTVYPLPDTLFTAERQYCKEKEADFIPRSVEAKYIWDYGDGSALDTVTTPGKHIYTRHGFYDVVLVSFSAHGCRDTSGARTIEVVNNAPPARFTLDKNLACGPEVDLNISVPEDEYTDVNLRFAWDFGNGESAETLVPPTPQRYTSGLFDTTYHVNFKVYNICNETHYVDSLKVGSVPKVSFALMHKRACSPADVPVKNTTTGSGLSYKWYFGDGETSEEYEPTHRYTTGSRATVYEIALVAVNGCNRDSVVKPIEILPNTISAFFEVPKNTICAGEEICFTNRSTDTARYISYKYWDFGDEVRDTSWNACHSYREGGRYKVLLYVDNGCGTDTISDTLRVLPLPKISLKSEDFVCQNDTFHFELPSDQPLQRVEWLFGDGKTSLERAPRYVYSGYGKFPVEVNVIAQNIGFCKVGANKQVEVYPNPDLSITPLDTLVCPHWLYEPKVEGEAAYLTWDYGDGSALTSSMTHLYENRGDSVMHHKVKLYAKSDKGCHTDYEGRIDVFYPAVAGIDKEVTYGKPEKVKFINLSKNYSECIWYLPPDRKEYTFENQQMEFDKNGLYAISLVAKNELGCIDSVVMEHEVEMKGLYFPNTFIPHSTNEKVSRFNGVGLGLKEYHLEIYDMYGNKVWETTEISGGQPVGGWDGRDNRGKLLPQGMYMWRARAIFLNDNVWTGDNNDSGVAQTVQGTVMMLRE